MRISSVTLKDFKRFKSLKVQDIPASARLVVITGANGSGKSALLEGLNVYRRQWHWGANDPTYFNKADTEGKFEAQNIVNVEFHGAQPTDRKKAIWVRSAYRHESEFNTPGIQKQMSPVEDPGADKLISGDRMVGANFTRLASSSLEQLFNPDNSNVTAGHITGAIIGPLQGALASVFDDLTLNNIIDPLVDGTFFFNKGASSHFPFKNLSAGERAVFDLLLDLAVRGSIFNDTVFAIDEPELHLSSKVQARLLDELLKLLPPGQCQLWIATHSPGMMKRALEMYQENPVSVTFLDTFGHNFDEEAILTPTAPSRSFWRRSLEIALDDIAGLVAPRQIILCEGNEAEVGFDAVCYREIFSKEMPDAEFVSVGSSTEVKEDKRGVAAAIQIIAPGTEVFKLIDRDDLSDNEVGKLLGAGTRVLSLRNIESYLFGDEIITLLYTRQGMKDRVQLALDKKRELLDESIALRKPSDDLKPIRNNFRAWLVKDLGTRQAGSTTLEFAQQMLVPLIKPGTDTYKKLKADIFGT